MLVFAAATLGMGADQIITGTAITAARSGATGTLYRTLYGASGAALSDRDEHAAADSAAVATTRRWQSLCSRNRR